MSNFLYTNQGLYLVCTKKLVEAKPSIREGNENKLTLTFHTYCLLSQKKKKQRRNEINILKTIYQIQEHYAKTMFSINY